MAKFIGRKIAPFLMLGLAVLAAPMPAQLARTFVSAAGGHDGNDCNRKTPCRTLQAAHDKTLDQGEVRILGPGDYGALTITKSISVINEGVGEAAISAPAGANGITVKAPANASVSLRGLTIQGMGSGGGAGLRFDGGFVLTMTNCIVRNHGGSGIDFLGNASSRLSIVNTVVADNGGSGIHVLPNPSATSVKATFKGIEFYNNGYAGLVLSNLQSGVISATMEDSVAVKNKFGLSVESSQGRPANLVVFRSVLANNDTGVFASGAVALRIGQSTIAGNTIAWTSSGGAVVQSFGDNDISGNGEGDPAPSPVAMK